MAFSWVWLGIVVAVFYMLPAVVAAVRNHPQAKTLLVLNATLGWTGIGWVFCLAWSFWNYDKD